MRTGYPAVNVCKGKPSHVILKDDAGTFTSTTQAVAASDLPLTWDTPVTKYISANRIQVKLVGKSGGGSVLLRVEPSVSRSTTVLRP
jgi:hypothetical protein